MAEWGAFEWGAGEWGGADGGVRLLRKARLVAESTTTVVRAGPLTAEATTTVVRHARFEVEGFRLLLRKGLLDIEGVVRLFRQGVLAIEGRTVTVHLERHAAFGVEATAQLARRLRTEVEALVVLRRHAFLDIAADVAGASPELEDLWNVLTSFATDFVDSWSVIPTRLVAEFSDMWEVRAAIQSGEFIDSWMVLPVIDDSVAGPVLSSPFGLQATILTGGGTWGAPTTVGYVVTAVNDNGETLASREITVDIDDTSESVGLGWVPIAGATGYRVFRTDTPGTYGPTSLVGTPSDPEFVDDGPLPGAGTPPSVNTTGPRTVVGTLRGLFGEDVLRVVTESEKS